MFNSKPATTSSIREYFESKIFDFRILDYLITWRRPGTASLGG